MHDVMVKKGIVRIIVKSLSDAVVKSIQWKMNMLDEETQREIKKWRKAKRQKERSASPEEKERMARRKNLLKRMASHLVKQEQVKNEELQATLIEILTNLAAHEGPQRERIWRCVGSGLR